MKLDFNINDLDQDLLEKITTQNVNSIYNSPSARRGRTKEEIKRAVSIGIPCEVFLIQRFNCEPNTEMYGDVIKPNGFKIECKSSTYKWTEDKMHEKAESIKEYSPSDVVIFWQKQGENYKYQGAKKIK